MLSLRRSSRPSARRPLFLEALESRWVPATLVYSGGNLAISNPTHFNGAGQGVVSVTQDPATGLFTVMDGTFFQGKFKITGNLSITGSTRADKISVLLNNTAGNGFLPGDVTINGGNGNDTITVDGTAGNASERVGGNLSVDGGNGDDQINVGTVAGITIRGNSNTIIGNNGNDSFNLGGGPGTTAIGGALSVYGTPNVNFTRSNILGGQLVTLQMSPTNTAQKFAALKLHETGVNTGLTLNTAPVTINGGNLGDVVTFDNSTNLGTTTITDGAGGNTLTLNAKVHGNFAYTAGNGNNVVTIGGAASITNASAAAPGDLTLKLGNGANTYNIDSGFHVAHDFTLTNGNGNLNVLIGATVGHFLTVNAGTGTNNVKLDGDVVNGGSATTTFGQFFYSFAGGGNQNTVTFDNDATQQIIANVIIPAVPGAYNLDVEFLGKNGTSGNPSPFSNTVNLTGGTNTAPTSSGAIMVHKHGDTVAVNNSLLGTIVVSQFA
jgi:hypothetical protein